MDTHLPLIPAGASADRKVVFSTSGNGAVPAGLLSAIAIGFLAGLWYWVRGHKQTLEQILDAIPLPLFVKDRAGNIRFVNRAITRKTGSGGEFRKFADVCWRSDDARVFAGDTVSEETTLRGAEGDRTVMSTRACVPNTQWGDIVVGVLQDITARKQAEEALRRSEELHRTLVERSPAMLWMWDALGQVEYVNPAVLSFTGLPLESMLGDGWLDRVHPDDFARLLTISVAARQKREPFAVQYRYRRADGEYRWIWYEGTPRVSQTGEAIGYIGSSVDITERRGEEKSWLELRTGPAAAPNKKGTTCTRAAGPQLEPAEPAGNPAAFLRTWVSDVLDFCRIAAGNLEIDPAAFRLRESLAAALQPVALAATAKGLRFALSVEDDVPDLLTGDSLRLSQVLRRLAGNAVKFTEAGGVVVGVRLREQAGTTVALEFSVADTGIGVAAGNLSQIDGTTARKHCVTGLGLAISARLVNLMGGTLEVESEPDSGSNFHFRIAFPLAGEPGTADPLKESKTEAEAATGRLRILLMADDAVNRLFLLRLLEQHGHEVELAGNPEESVAAAERSQFDLLLIDVEGPDQDGLGAASAIRRKEAGDGRHVPIVALTAHAKEADWQLCLEAGVDAYLTKPVQAAELFKPVDEIGAMEFQDQLATLNRAVALERVGGDAQLLRDIADLFLAEYPKLLEAIRSAVRSGDPLGVERNAHNLKGSVGNFGAERAYQAALQLETMGREKQLDAAPEALKKLETALDALRPELAELTSVAA